MSSDPHRRVPSRAWLGVAAITLGVGTVLTPGMAHAEPSTPGNPSGSGSSGTAGEPKPNNSTTAEEQINHRGTTGTTECKKKEEEQCLKPGDTAAAVPAGATAPSTGPILGSGNSTVPTGTGTDTVPAGLGNSTIVGG